MGNSLKQPNDLILDIMSPLDIMRFEIDCKLFSRLKGGRV